MTTSATATVSRLRTSNAMNFVERSRDDDGGSKPHDDDNDYRRTNDRNNQKPL